MLTGNHIIPFHLSFIYKHAVCTLSVHLFILISSFLMFMSVDLQLMMLLTKKMRVVG
ncbi:hypothetical protein HanPSC8_Chr01g0037211 [Helianthus annuus]|nr:hypothetical protein HanPSC8_Chr01g0037211 [Helianthus annuus]